MRLHDDAYILLEQHICPALDDLLELAATSLTREERRTIRRGLEMFEELLGDVQEHTRAQAIEHHQDCPAWAEGNPRACTT